MSAKNGTNPLSPAQLAEGARLLEVWRNNLGSAPSVSELLQSQDEWQAWLHVHGAHLLSAAHRAAEAEGCVREIVDRLNEEADIDTAAIRKGLSIDLHDGRATAFQAAIGWITAIASRHNINLSESTP